MLSTLSAVAYACTSTRRLGQAASDVKPHQEDSLEHQNELKLKGEI